MTAAPTTAATLDARFRAVRAHSAALCAPLEVEDYSLQSMPDASPPKWHLAHSSWFFEQFVLAPGAPGYRPFHPQFAYLFNSYYNAVGERAARAERGHLTRPTVREVYAYRAAIDGAMHALLERGDLPGDALSAVELGLHHEQQHQELLLTDLKHGLGLNPLLPTYSPDGPHPVATPGPAGWARFGGGLAQVGAEPDSGFHFDNEGPRHTVYLRPYELATHLTTVGEFRAFIDAGGYTRAEFWLSDGFAECRRHNWTAPGYWHPHGRAGALYTLAGVRPLDDSEPVCHLSYYEADAYARWAGARLPAEAEWEHAAAAEWSVASGEWPVKAGPGGLSSTDHYPLSTVHSLHGVCWQWTQSPYTPYPGYRAAAGALGEYNGKFMCNQMVLRGSSCVTPAGHARDTYRNFFPPGARWQFTGVRLARDS